VRVPDVNVLVCARNSASTNHGQARDWLERALAGPGPVGLAPAALVGFVRVATGLHALERPLTVSDAFDQVEEWLAQPRATVIHPGRRHFAICRELLEANRTAGNLTSDAHLAALAIEHHATLASFDSDFHRFAGLNFEFLR
jgi:toxin-antitoxin system PIN domain toxin